MSKKLSLGLCLMTLLLIAVASNADTAGLDMANNLSANPNGPWSYGFRYDAASTELGMLTYQATSWNGLNELKGWAYAADTFPVIVVNTGSEAVYPYGGGAVNPNEIFMHPNNFQFNNVVRWTASSAGQYDVSSYWRDISAGSGEYADGTVIGVVVNGVSIYSHVMGEGDPQVDWSDTLTLGLGDVVDFVMNCNNYYNYDSTAFNATVSMVPEPTTLALVSFGGLAAFCRSRRKA